MSKQRFFHDSMKFCMLGSGSWATALMKLLLNKQTNVGWFVRSQSTIDYMVQNNRNPNYLTAVTFDTSKFRMTTDINEAVHGANTVVLAIPAVFIPDALSSLTEDISGKFVVSAVKGLIPDTNETVSEYFNRRYDLPYTQLGVLSGPCHAEEVALERLSYLTFSCIRKNLAEFISQSFEAPYLRMIASTDVYGSEYAAVLKNIYAIAAGICHGLGYGDNFLSVLVSNSFEEMRRYLNDTNLSPRQTTRSAYLGDLLVTCYSQFSRNRTFGGMIGKGYSVSAVQVEMNMVAEGYYASRCMHEINKRYGVPMPIADTIYRILYENSPAREEIQQLTEMLM